MYRPLTARQAGISFAIGACFAPLYYLLLRWLWPGTAGHPLWLPFLDIFLAYAVFSGVSALVRRWW